MKEFKGTPGPWLANPVEQYYNGSNNTFEVNHGTDGECVAEVVNGLANAKLISAAPDLLKNLIRLVDRMEENNLGHMTAVTRAKEAITKALGE